MSGLHERLLAIAPARLLQMRRGIEKESLRTASDGTLDLTPHPAALGAALTHPNITTDFSESQLELITGVHTGVDDCLAELRRIHQFVYHQLGEQQLWVASMPCELPDDAQIPIGRYGTSNVGQAKTVYRTGLSHRYGRRMQTISGIHYNWSLPGLDTADYFGLIRNFRRHSFLLLLLFGASPALSRSFSPDARHGLQALGEQSHFLPHATSLRMGRLGYQSDAQSTLSVSYNSLDSYGASLQDALTRPYPAYEAIGLRDPDGSYRQLSTSLLQIENEFYGTIRPKRVIRSGERPLHALRERGVEYVEVRCMDLDPFHDIGIDADTAHFLDVFLLHCALSDSPPDSPRETAELASNQQTTATCGREPGVRLWRAGLQVTLTSWAGQLLDECGPIAERLDNVHGGDRHRRALQAAMTALCSFDKLPSARVLDAITNQHAGSYLDFVRSRSAQTRQALLARPWSAADQAPFERLAATSRDDQARIEAADTTSFESFRQAYLSPEQLSV